MPRDTAEAVEVDCCGPPDGLADPRPVSQAHAEQRVLINFLLKHLVDQPIYQVIIRRTVGPVACYLIRSTRCTRILNKQTCDV
jgi:hypothetical protein